MDPLSAEVLECDLSPRIVVLDGADKNLFGVVFTLSSAKHSLTKKLMKLLKHNKKHFRRAIFTNNEVNKNKMTEKDRLVEYSPRRTRRLALYTGIS